MRIAKNLMSLILIVQLIKGCATIKEENFSYQVTTYTLDTSKDFIYYNNLISYGAYLFEFKNRINIVTNIHGPKSRITAYADTVGLYLLSNNNLYYEFDTFALKNELVKMGKLSDKQSGYKFKVLNVTATSDLSFTPPKDTVINNIKCFIAGIVSNDQTAKDTIKQEVILIKNKNLNSLYKMNGIKFPDRSYCIVGFRIYDLKNKLSFLQEIESLKPLTEKEKEICARMVKQSKLINTDTIRKESKL